MSIFVRRFANGFLLNEEGACVDEGHLYLDDLALIEAVAEKLNIDLDAIAVRELQSPEQPQTPSEGEDSTETRSDEQLLADLAKHNQFLQNGSVEQTE